ncbi:isoleucine--tRNA ligase [bacterium]|uniref:Isoleucine--tRNA ligase n=1 Tax=candidate division WWE3 bacterium CG22_combo_CG10-13_8_21_14_all_39_12 TaxID=1975094 RepID=A0A2H0BES2_UNCKA|nr:isoleucine--tRNA ligase [bacterium]PIP56167.1 MAG: isoleucine--tRNA ligase [candidate division WWE3 bacterium CG22_combo_CG10-13_8_21_14_all_39_12]
MKVPDSHPDFPQLESEILLWWKENNISTEYRLKNENSDTRFSFLDGPITANNPMGVHHAHGRTIKDTFQRYKNAQGFKQRFQNGFDCQGLWVEVEEEKDLGFNSKRDIEEFGIGNFCESCNNRVERFSKVQEEQSKRLGMFMDWEHSYYTKSERNNLHIWYFLKQVQEKGWLYKGVDAMPWCTRCGTAISQHELSDGGYKTVKHTSVFVKFRVNSGNGTHQKLVDTYKLGSDKVSFLVWTTTPWTLLSNDALAINPTLTYVIAKQQLNDVSEYLILAKARTEVLESKGEFEIVAEFTGQELLDLISTGNGVYETPFNFLDADRRLLAWSDVSEEDGTGIVHIAPSAGKEDFELSKVNNLSEQSKVSSIDDFGVYNEKYGIYAGQSVFDVKEQIFADLKQSGAFYKFKDITHSYPHCWRCKHELVFRTTSEWFIRADEIRPKMKAAVDTVNWMPEHAAKRMHDWLDNMGDWPISRKRYWGLALPFFENEDKTKVWVVGSKEELRELALEPEKVDSLPDLHRPWVDDVYLDGTKMVIDGKAQTGVWKRVTDVGDCWLDAGIVPFSTVDYLTNKEYWADWYPFEFITEYASQIKLWFYATLFMSVTLENRAPWENVLTTGFLVDENGDEMHKSAGNSIPFDEAAQKAGADAIRWLYLKDRVANHHGTGNLRFGYTILDEVRRRFQVITWNTYKFFMQNAIMDNWQPQMGTDIKPQHILDEWVLSRYTSVLEGVTASMDLFDTPAAVALLEQFIINDVSQWYIRRSRDRVGPSAISADDKESFYQTGYYVLSNVLTMLSPFVPFMSEALYQDLRTNDNPSSVHLTEWPNSNGSFKNETLEAEMVLVRDISEQVHAKRKEQGIKVRQPLSSITVYTNGVHLTDQSIETLTDEVNIKEVIVHPAKDDLDLCVEIDTLITPELAQEGMVREFIRAVQNIRKQAEFDLDQTITVSVDTTDQELLHALTQHQDEVKRKLLATKLEFESNNTSKDTDTITINGSTATITLCKV